MATLASTELPLYRIDVDTYHRLAEAGALDGMDVELLEGLLIDQECSRKDPVHRIDVGTYHRMVASGALEGKRIELLEGLLVEMSPKSPAHVVVLKELVRHFTVPPPVWTQAQDPIEVAWDCEPEPDFALASRKPPPGRHLRTALLVVEVAVTSHWLDRGRKAILYAGADIPNYWLIDVPGRAVEVHTQPGPQGYEKCDVYREGSRVPSPLDGVSDLDIAVLLAGVDS
jgi:Uma2 family endonuclease